MVIIIASFIKHISFDVSIAFISFCVRRRVIVLVDIFEAAQNEFFVEEAVFSFIIFSEFCGVSSSSSTWYHSKLKKNGVGDQSSSCSQ